MPCWQRSAFPNISFWSVCLKPYNVMLNTYTATSDQIFQAMAINHWQKNPCLSSNSHRKTNPGNCSPIDCWPLKLSTIFPEITWQWPKCPWPPTAGKCRQSFGQNFWRSSASCWLPLHPLIDWQLIAHQCPVQVAIANNVFFLATGMYMYTWGSIYGSGFVQ